MKIDISVEDLPLTEKCYWCHGSGQRVHFDRTTLHNINVGCADCDSRGILMTPFGQAVLDHVATYGHLDKNNKQ